MHIDLNTTDERPIYAQIVDQVKFAIAAGLCGRGSWCPSVRELSKQLVVNPNTVARAYRDLQAEGMLEAVRGTGLQVTRAAPGRCRDGAAGDRPAAAPRGDGGGPAQRPGPAAEIEAMIREEWARGNGEAGGRRPRNRGGGRP